MPAFSILIPFHSDHGDRLRVYRWLREYYTRELPEAEVLTGDDDTGDELLNRSRMRNNAAAAATTDLFVFLDADAYVLADDLREMVRLVRDGAVLVQPTAVHFLTREATGRQLRRKRWKAPGAGDIRRTFQPVTGHCFVCSRAMYNLAGGFDERYRGWGGEDPAFALAIEKLTGRTRTRTAAASYHLEHPRPADLSESASHHRPNGEHFARLQRVQSASEARVFLHPHLAARGVLRILGLCSNYPPVLCAGVERSMHARMQALQRQGHDCAVITHDAGQGAFDGMPLIRWGSPQEIAELAGGYDVLIGSHNGMIAAAEAARLAGKPCFALVHNDRYRREADRCRELGAVIYSNSRWVQQALGTDGYLWPQVNASEYLTDRTGDAITIIGLSKNKGEMFWLLAERFPEHRFLAVCNAYEPQIIPETIPANVTLLDVQQDMRAVYRETRLLLMPSRYESFGRTAMEACCNGIPVLAHATPGLREALGEECAANLLCGLEVDAWAEMIAALDDPRAYADAGRRARERFTSYAAESARQMAAFTDHLMRSVREGRRPAETATFRSLRTPDMRIRPLRVTFSGFRYQTDDPVIIAALRSGRYLVEEIDVAENPNAR